MSDLNREIRNTQTRERLREVPELVEATLSDFIVTSFTVAMRLRQCLGLMVELTQLGGETAHFEELCKTLGEMLKDNFEKHFGYPIDLPLKEKT